MGNPMAPTIANIFLCDLETKFLETCPSNCSPIFYRRYLDDTFVIFKSQSECQNFFNYLNTWHENIQFTIEEEQDSKLSFLDVTVLKQNSQNLDSQNLDYKIFRKSSFTGLGTSYFSNIFPNYKKTIIYTLIHRAYELSSSYINFHFELEFLRNYFKQNGYPEGLFNSAVRKFLNTKYGNKLMNYDVPKEIIYIKLPYLGNYFCEDFSKFIRKKLSTSYPQIDFRFVFVNSFQIGSFFKIKEHLPDDLRSGIIYKYTCDACQASYIGSTLKQSKVRFFQHIGISHRTHQPLTSNIKSSIRDHCHSSDHRIKISNFSILANSNASNIRILESLYIKILRPSLNIEQSAAPLNFS